MIEKYIYLEYDLNIETGSALYEPPQSPVSLLKSLDVVGSKKQLEKKFWKIVAWLLAMPGFCQERKPVLLTTVGFIVITPQTLALLSKLHARRESLADLTRLFSFPGANSRVNPLSTRKRNTVGKIAPYLNFG